MVAIYQEDTIDLNSKLSNIDVAYSNEGLIINFAKELVIANAKRKTKPNKLL